MVRHFFVILYSFVPVDTLVDLFGFILVDVVVVVVVVVVVNVLEALFCFKQGGQR